MKTILHIDASGHKTASDSRKLSKQLVQKIQTTEQAEVIYRDVSQDLPFLDETMITSYFTAPDERSDELKQAIAISDQVVEELQRSDVIVIGIPIYNFSMPAGFKAWVDLVARAGVTFQYTENGPVGLLENKKAYLAITSGGVPLDSPSDFLTPWLRQFFGFIGINDVNIIDASAINSRGNTALESAKAEIQALPSG